MEVVDFIELLNLPFSLGNAVKYLCRCNDKNPKYEDQAGELDKILYYIGREQKSLSYPWTPQQHDVLIQEFVAEYKKQLPDPLFKGLYWVSVYIRCNKVTELKASKADYLQRAMNNIVWYRNELEEENTNGD
jgi:hypothetical protein